MSLNNIPIAVKINFNDSSSSSSISELSIDPEEFLKSNNLIKVNRSENPTLSNQNSLFNTSENSESYSQNSLEYKF